MNRPRRAFPLKEIKKHDKRAKGLAIPILFLLSVMVGALLYQLTK